MTDQIQIKDLRLRTIIGINDDEHHNFQHQHRLNLFQWLQDRFNDGDYLVKVCNQLALPNS